LQEWYRNSSDCTAASFPELRQTFGSADYVDGYTIFDVGGNKYRIAAVIHFDKQRVYVRAVMTHSGYEADHLGTHKHTCSQMLATTLRRQLPHWSEVGVSWDTAAKTGALQQRQRPGEDAPANAREDVCHSVTAFTERYQGSAPCRYNADAHTARHCIRGRSSMQSTESQTYTLPSGAEIEIQTLPGRGAREVAADADKPALAKVLAPLGEVAQLVLDQVRSAVRTPDEVQIELGAALKGKTTLVLVSGETEATLKVTLTWTKPPDKTDPAA